MWLRAQARPAEELSIRDASTLLTAAAVHAAVRARHAFSRPAGAAHSPTGAAIGAHA